MVIEAVFPIYLEAEKPNIELPRLLHAEDTQQGNRLQHSNGHNHSAKSSHQHRPRASAIFLYERRWIAELPTEDELRKRLALPGRKIALSEGLGKAGRVSPIADGQTGPGFVIFGYRVQRARFVRENPDHLMNEEAPRRCLHQEVR